MPLTGFCVSIGNVVSILALVVMEHDQLQPSAVCRLVRIFEELIFWILTGYFGVESAGDLGMVSDEGAGVGRWVGWDGGAAAWHTASA